MSKKNANYKLSDRIASEIGKPQDNLNEYIERYKTKDYEAPSGCTFPLCPNEDPHKCTNEIFNDCPAREPGEYEYGEIEIGSFPSFWYPAPRTYDLELVDQKRRMLSDTCCKKFIHLISETIFTDASKYPYIFVRITVGGVKSFKRGATFSVSISKNDNRIWAVGAPIHTHFYERNCIFTGDGSITIVDKKGNAARYPVDNRLRDISIPCDLYPYKAMPMSDAIRLCDRHKPRTKILKHEFKKTLALCPHIVEFMA